MGLESSNFCNEFLNSIIHDTTIFHRNPISTETITSNPSPETAGEPNSRLKNDQNLVAEGWKKKKNKWKKARVCKKKEDQRMSHIVVERNRRKQMNHHLAVLRSLLPESYIQRGDQASIIGGAIDFIKVLEHLLQSLEAQKFLSTQQNQFATIQDQNGNFATTGTKECEKPKRPLCFHKLFSNLQYTWSQVSTKNTSKSKATMADIEVNLVQTHVHLRFLSRKRLTHLSKFIAFLQSCYLSILHLSAISLDPLVLYSISLQVEEECWLKSADEIAGAVHQMLELLQEEAALCIDSCLQNYH